MAVEQFPTAPAVGDKATATQADIVAADAVIADSGNVTITPSAANTPTSSTIAFNKTFPSIPHVMVTPETGVPGSTVTGWSANNITATGCDIVVTRTNTTNVKLHWVAVLTH